MMNSKLYKKDQNGNIRVWWMEQDGDAYRTHSGIDGGKIVVSGWKYGEAKNYGKINSTTPVEQAALEIVSQYTMKRNQGKYFDDIEDAKNEKVTYFSPMLAVKFADLKKPLSFPTYSQPKLDGVRCIATKDGLFSRNGKPLVSTPHIHKELCEKIFSDYRYEDYVLDGELYNHILKDDFDEIISLARKTKPTDDDLIAAQRIEYHVYDIYDGDLEFGDRLTKLTQLKLNKLEYIKQVETRCHFTEQELDELYVRFLEDGYEGQMIRIRDSKYENKRSKGLIKRKEFNDEEFEIVAVNEGVGCWAGIAKSLTIRLNDGTIQESGLRGTYETNKQRLIEKNDYVGGKATVRYQNMTPDGKLRFPVAVALWKDEREI